MQNHRAIPFMLLVLLALGAVLAATPTPHDTSAVDTHDLKTRASDKSHVGTRADEPIFRLLRDFSGAHTDTDAMAWFYRSKSYVTIATLPDPDESQVGYTFYQYLSALYLAATSTHWEFDRGFLPWHPRDPSSAGSNGPASVGISAALPNSNSSPVIGSSSIPEGHVLDLLENRRGMQPHW